MADPQHSRPLLLGVLFGALAPAIVMGAQVLASPERIMISVLLVVLIAFVMSLAASVLLGLPFALWLRSKGLLRALPLCIAGLVVGAVAMTGFSYQTNYFSQMNDQSLTGWIAWNSAKKGIIPGAILGAISAAAFCLGAGIRIRSR